jgi:hypothetical protein
MVSGRIRTADIVDGTGRGVDRFVRNPVRGDGQPM